MAAERISGQEVEGNCSCHDHDHSHGGHGHLHEHEHAYREKLELAYAELFLEAHTHDQAATVSIGICPHEGREIPFKSLVAAMQDIARAVEDVGGIVGHIKAFAKQGEAFAHASVTAAGIDASCEGDAALALGFEADIQMVAIALLLEQDALVEICKKSLIK